MVVVDLGCRWRSGSVRLRALQMLAVDDPERAVLIAGTDPSEVVWRGAHRLARSSVASNIDSDEGLESIGRHGGGDSNQLALFGQAMRGRRESRTPTIAHSGELSELANMAGRQHIGGEQT